MKKKSFWKKVTAIVLSAIFCVSGIIAVDVDEILGNTGPKLSVRLTQLIDKKYPTMKGYLTVENEEGLVVTGLSKNSISANVDGYANHIGSLEISQFKTSSEGVSYNIVFPVNLQRATMNIQAQAILQFVDKMGDRDKISLYTMGAAVQPVKSISLEGSETTCEDVLKKDFKPEMISNFQVEEDQAPKIYDSIASLVQKVSAKPEDRKVLIVISDERDNESIIGGPQLLRTINAANVPMYMIGIRAPSTGTTIRSEDMAIASQGKYYYTPMIRDLRTTLLKIIDFVQDAYIIDVKTSGGLWAKLNGGDGNTHTLEIKVQTNSGSGSSSRTFTAYKKAIPFYFYIIILAVVVLAVLIVVFIVLFTKKRRRASLGITNRRCPDCGERMKDSWDECPFCKYLPGFKESQQKKGKNKKAKKGGKGGKGGKPDLKGGMGKAKGGLGKAKGFGAKAKGLGSKFGGGGGGAAAQ